MKLMRTLTLSAVVLLAAACYDFDVVAQDAVKSFQELTVALPPLDRASENRFELKTADGELVSINKTWSRGESDVTLDLDARPFVKAGVDPARLPKRFRYDGPANRLTVEFDLGAVDPAVLPPTLLALFEGTARQYRSRVGYHEQFDHYGLDLGHGTMLEWAKDLTRNDKDFVLVLEPKPFLEAGLKTENLSGWVLGKVKVKDKDGKTVEVEKLLKPYNLQ